MENIRLEWLENYLEDNNYKLVIRGTYGHFSEIYFNEDNEHTAMFIPFYGYLKRFISVEFRENTFVFRNHRYPDGLPLDEEEVPYEKMKYPRLKIAELFGRQRLRISQWIGKREAAEKDEKIKKIAEKIEGSRHPYLKI